MDEPQFTSAGNSSREVSDTLMTLAARASVMPFCVLTGFLVTDVDVESEDDEQGDERRPPVDDKHHQAAQDRSGQRHPHVVVLEAGAPPCGDNATSISATDGQMIVICENNIEPSIRAEKLATRQKQNADFDLESWQERSGRRRS